MVYVIHANQRVELVHVMIYIVAHIVRRVQQCLVQDHVHVMTA